MNPGESPPPLPCKPEPCGLARKSRALALIGLAAFAVGAVFFVLASNSRSNHYSVVIATLGLIAWPILALTAILCGVAAILRIRKSAGRLTGKRIAIVGVIAGCGQLLTLVLLIAIPNLVEPPTAQKNQCVDNLRQIDGAKEQWMLEHNLAAGMPPDARAINVFLKNGQAPVCPEGGTYTYNAVGVAPTCSLGAARGHTLPP